MKHTEQWVELLKTARQRIRALELGRHQEIAVIGLGCRFPGKIDRVEKLWEALCSGRDCFVDIPSDRWSKDAFYHPDPEVPGKLYVRKGGFIDEVDCFDYPFFDLSKREADAMDPQQRLVLETTWRALEHARLSKDAVRSGRTGIFIGQSWQDYELNLQQQPVSAVTAHTGLGNMRSVTAGRLAHWLGTRGPAMVIDTACSSSLVAIHQGVLSLRQGESDLVIAGGVSLMLSPRSMVFCCKLKALSFTDRSQPFSEEADGYVRGEGCGIVVLKRLEQALEDGDPIVAVIKGSAVNHDGHTSGLTVPSREAQIEVITAALKDAQIDSEAVDYVEAHGVGTRLGDPIELGALSAVFGVGRPGHWPFSVGSIKARMGHLEAAAGVAGFIKTALMIQKKKILSQIQIQGVPREDALFSQETQPQFVPHCVREWPREPCLAGVSAFSISGTNAHVVLGGVESVASVGGTERPPVRYRPFARYRCGFEKRTLFYRSQWRPLPLRQAETAAVKGRRVADCASDCATLLLSPAFFEEALIGFPVSRTIVLGRAQAAGFQSECRIREMLASLEQQAIELFVVLCPSLQQQGLPKEASDFRKEDCVRSYRQDLQTLAELVGVLKQVLQSGKTIQRCVVLTVKNDCSVITSSVSALLKCVLLEAPLQFLGGDCVEVETLEAAGRALKEQVDETPVFSDRVYREGRCWLREVSECDQELFYFDDALLAYCLNEQTVQSCLRASQRQLCLPKNTAYLITGGLGRLGQIAAYCLALLGARHLILLGRGPRSHLLPPLSEKLKRLGVETVTFLSADVSSLSSLQTALESVRETLPRIDGVIHAAGERHDQLFTRLSLDELERAYSAKVLGALHLHHLLQQTSFFITYSSTAGMCGAAGQGAYAAANAALQAVVSQRLAAGQSATTIVWGPWEKGMTEGLTPSQRRRLQQRGFYFLSSYEGIKALATVIVQQLEGEMIVADVAPEVFRFSALTPATEGQDPLQYLLTVLSKMTGIPQDSIDRELGLMDLGLDSLMLLEFQMTIEQDWGCQLSPSFLFDYPTVKAIEVYLSSLS